MISTPFETKKSVVALHCHDEDENSRFLAFSWPYTIYPSSRPLRSWQVLWMVIMRLDVSPQMLLRLLKVSPMERPLLLQASTWQINLASSLRKKTFFWPLMRTHIQKPDSSDKTRKGIVFLHKNNPTYFTFSFLNMYSTFLQVQNCQIQRYRVKYG